MSVMREAFADESSLRSVVRHLPSLVTSYHPSQNNELQLDSGHSRTLFVGWLERVTGVIGETLGQTLRHVQSVGSVTNLTKPYIQVIQGGYKFRVRFDPHIIDYPHDLPLYNSVTNTPNPSLPTV